MEGATSHHEKHDLGHLEYVMIAIGDVDKTSDFMDITKIWAIKNEPIAIGRGCCCFSITDIVYYFH